MKTKLLRLEKGTYVDQLGVEHDCRVVIDEAEVESTGEYHNYEYYNTTIKNPYYEDEQGRRWLCWVPTDWGGSASWRREIGSIPVDELWIQDRRDRVKDLHYYGMTPICWPEELGK